MTRTLHQRVMRFIGGDADNTERDSLIVELATAQAETIPPYARLLKARPAPKGWPAALPTDVFRYARLAAHPASLDIHRFLTSGTTHGARGSHAFQSMEAYDTAAERFAREMLFPDVDRMRLVVLAPRAQDAPESSLSYMLSRFEAWFASDAEFVWPLDTDALTRALDTREPVAILGTSFAFVHAEDALEHRFDLAPGSRLMQTGGFKGRSRTIDPEPMRHELSQRYGLPESHIVAEYGMTELSSQLYETTLRAALELEDPGPRRLRAPHWVRVTTVDPDTLRPLESQAPGLVRIDDLANLHSVCCLQTSDRAVRVEDGIELLGRDASAVPRGCSLAVEEALAGENVAP